MAQKFVIFIDSLSGATDRIEILKKCSDKTGIKSGWFGFGFFCFLVSFVLFGVASKLLTNLVGVVYPAYQSFKAIESKDGEDDTQWLVYWAIFCPLFILDNVQDWLLFWMPFYYPLKLAFIFFLFSPRFQGAKRIYEKWCKKYLDQYGPSIDSKLNLMKNKGDTIVESAKEEARNIQKEYERQQKEAEKQKKETGQKKVA